MRESEQSLKAEMRAAISSHRERVRGRRPRWLVGTEDDEPQDTVPTAGPPAAEPVEAELPQRRWWQFGRRR